VNAILSADICAPFGFHSLRVDLAIHCIHKMIDMVDHEMMINNRDVELEFH
jgi:hypothetical protein